MLAQFKKYIIPNHWRNPFGQFCQTLGFWSRLPMPHQTDAAPFSMDMLARFTLPAGLLLGLLLSTLALILWVLHMPEGIAAAFILIASAALTGGLHEDGLADCADALGGKTVAQRLEIMKESYIGTFGGMSLMFSLLVRWQALVIVFDEGLGLTLSAILAAAIFSRAMALVPFGLLPAVRDHGLAANLGTLSPPYFYSLIVLAFATSALLLAPHFSIHAFVLMSFAIAAALWGILTLSSRLLSGLTGDVGGATQQVVEIIVLVCVATFGV